MRISTKGRYALSIMISLARKYNSDKYISLKDISEKEKISLKYLEKIMINLKKCDFFIVAKGKDGGYKLKRNPSDYSIGEIIRGAEENLNIVDCVGKDNCFRREKCNTYPLWKGLSDEINDYLDSKYLSDYL